MSDSAREWTADSGETKYWLKLERQQLTLGYYDPPEYQYRLRDSCSAADFVGGKLNDEVRRLFGAAVLAEALDAARRA